MFSGRFAITKMEDGSVFLDRDGNLFEYVLEYLRHGTISATGTGLLKKLQREFDYFGLEVLARKEQPMAIVGGGEIRGDNGTNITLRYNPDTDTWSPMPSMQNAKSFCVMCTSKDSIFAFHLRVGKTYVERLNVNHLNRWQHVASFPEMFSFVACDVEGSIHIFGGSTTKVLRYEEKTNDWKHAFSMPTHRNNSSACVVDGKVYIFGGKNKLGERLATADIYCSRTKRWSTMEMPQAISSFGVGVLDGMIYVVGGISKTGKDLASVFRFDPVEKIWDTVAPMPAARFLLSTFVLDGCLYAVGGRNCTNNQLSVVEKYEPNTNSWLSMASLPEGRAAPGSAVMTLPALDFFEDALAKASH
jgi:N-acetylneuraminic acid mutarotase